MMYFFLLATREPLWKGTSSGSGSSSGATKYSSTNSGVVKCSFTSSGSPAMAKITINTQITFCAAFFFLKAHFIEITFCKKHHKFAALSTASCHPIIII